MFKRDSGRKNRSSKAADFAALGCELLGLSIDIHYAHIAWVRNIKENFGVDITFPIIADLSMQVAHAYDGVAEHWPGRLVRLHPLLNQDVIDLYNRIPPGSRSSCSDGETPKTIVTNS